MNVFISKTYFSISFFLFISQVYTTNSQPRKNAPQSKEPLNNFPSSNNAIPNEQKESWEINDEIWPSFPSTTPSSLDLYGDEEERNKDGSVNHKRNGNTETDPNTQTQMTTTMSIITSTKSLNANQLKKKTTVSSFRVGNGNFSANNFKNDNSNEKILKYQNKVESKEGSKTQKTANFSTGVLIPITNVPLTPNNSMAFQNLSTNQTQASIPIQLPSSNKTLPATNQNFTNSIFTQADESSQILAAFEHMKIGEEDDTMDLFLEQLTKMNANKSSGSNPQQQVVVEPLVTASDLQQHVVVIYPNKSLNTLPSGEETQKCFNRFKESNWNSY